MDICIQYYNLTAKRISSTSLAFVIRSEYHLPHAEILSFSVICVPIRYRIIWQIQETNNVVIFQSTQRIWITRDIFHTSDVAYNISKVRNSFRIENEHKQTTFLISYYKNKHKQTNFLISYWKQTQTNNISHFLLKTTFLIAYWKQTQSNNLSHFSTEKRHKQTTFHCILVQDLPT